MKRKEQIEQITVFRNENGSPVGLIITEDESPEPVYGAFVYTLPNGWRWVIESTDKERVYREAREVFFYHTHFCPQCEFDVCCDLYHECQDPEADLTCEDCKPKAPVSYEQFAAHT
jgi:hypothetical protein